MRIASRIASVLVMPRLRASARNSAHSESSIRPALRFGVMVITVPEEYAEQQARLYVQTEQERQMAGRQADNDPSVRRADTAVLRITIAATVAALALSFRNQIDFATQRGGYPVWGAILWALIIDSPVIVGELRLYSAAARHEGGRIKAWAWTLTLSGLLVSMAAGAAHVTTPGWLPVKVLAAAVPPLAAAASLGTGLGIVKLNAARNKDGGAGQGTASRRLPDPSPQTAGIRVRQPGITGKQARSRASSTAPSYAQLAVWAAADREAGLPMGRVSFHKRHADDGVTEHHARMFLDSQANGGQPVTAS